MTPLCDGNDKGSGVNQFPKMRNESLLRASRNENLGGNEHSSVESNRKNDIEGNYSIMFGSPSPHSSYASVSRGRYVVGFPSLWRVSSGTNTLKRWKYILTQYGSNPTVEHGLQHGTQ